MRALRRRVSGRTDLSGRARWARWILTSPRTTTLGALSLRAWALDLFVARDPGTRPAPGDWIARDAPATWEVFLRSERCALPLRSRLGRGAPTSLPSGPERVLKARATAELQRILSVRGQLLQIQDLAERHGLEPIVLKGGVAALSGDEPVDVADVDVLLPREQAELLARLLDERGYRSRAVGSAAHLPMRFAPEVGQVEVHFAIEDLDHIGELRSRASPLPGFPGLWRLSPPDHVWHLLVHSVMTHPNRRGCLRDLLLASSAVHECSSSDVEDITRRISEHSERRRLGAVLELAQALARGVAVVDSFSAEAAANYLLRTRLMRVARSRVLALPVGTSVFALLGSRSDREAAWTELSRGPEVSTWQFLAATERRWPWFGRVTRGFLRTLRLVLAWLVALPIAASARRIAARSASTPSP